jgi:hypothetical protein
VALRTAASTATSSMDGGGGPVRGDLDGDVTLAPGCDSYRGRWQRVRSTRVQVTRSRDVSRPPAEYPGGYSTLPEVHSEGGMMGVVRAA